MIILYYLQKRSNPHIKTIGLLCYKEFDANKTDNEGIYFYLENNQYKLINIINNMEIDNDYEILKELSIPSYNVTHLTFGLSSETIIEQCKKFILEANTPQYKYVLHEIMRSSITYPLGKILFEAAFKKAIPGPLVLLSAESIPEFIQAVEGLINTINGMQAKGNILDSDLTTQSLPVPKFFK